VPILIWIILATLFGGLLSAALASLFLFYSEPRRARLLPHLISFATGAMLAAALLGLLPEAIVDVGPGRVQAVGAALLGGIAFFFVLEKLVLWRPLPHRGLRAASCALGAKSRRAAAWIVLFGDGVHNAFDGVLIAAAFLTDVRLGIVTTIAITAHEIPQELGDLAVLLHSGMKPVRALLVQRREQPDLDYRWAGRLPWPSRARWNLLPYAISVAAASLLYVAVADLIPGPPSACGPPAVPCRCC